MRHSVYGAALAVVLASAMACRSAGSFDGRNTSTRAPDPSGCYVRVFDAPDYRGADEYINGPAKLERLTSLPGGKSWDKRIRSARLGPTAIVTMWNREKYAGERWLMSEMANPSLPALFDRAIASLEIRCAPASNTVAATNHPEPDRR